MPLSIFPNEPQYSVRARKQETQAYYSLELLSQYLISAPAYGQETISMICYLKSKEDKADFLASQYTEGKCYLQMGIRRDSGGHPGSPEHDPAFRTSKM